MKLHDDLTVLELSKKIYLTNIMPSGSSASFLKLSSQLIFTLQNGAELGKIKRILRSELGMTYGLSVPKNLVKKIAREVYEWYQE